MKFNLNDLSNTTVLSTLEPGEYTLSGPKCDCLIYCQYTQRLTTPNSFHNRFSGFFSEKHFISNLLTKIDESL